MATPSTPMRIRDQAPRPRIVQHRNRRYSIRLEPIFWRTLETLAERRGLRLGRFVAELASGFRGSNFSSYLRVYCMTQAERALVATAYKAGQASLGELISSSFTPGLLLSRYRTILSFNAAFSTWVGLDPETLVGADLTAVIQVRTKRSLNELWLDMVAGKESRAEARVLYVAPGRVLAAQAHMIGLRSPDGLDFFAVMWLGSGAPKSIGEALVRPAVAQTRPLPV